jgi:beta-phosphoglucomutase-like phosphatase (HAD superfamily)
MPAHPDVADGLAGLRDDGFRLVTLTNSPPNPLGPSPLESAGLGGFFERQFSVDACHTCNPARDVYHYVCPELQVVPAECMMVAAHVWDTIGAQSAGFTAVLITPARQRAIAARRAAATDARRSRSTPTRPAAQYLTSRPHEGRGSRLATTMVEELTFAEVWAGAHSCGDALCSSMTSRWPEK